MPGGPELLAKLPRVSDDKRLSLIGEARVALDAIRRGQLIVGVGKDVKRAKKEGDITELDIETEDEIIQIKGGNFSNRRRLGKDLAQFNKTADAAKNVLKRFDKEGNRLPPKTLVWHFTNPPVHQDLIRWLEGKGVVVRLGPR